MLGGVVIFDCELCFHVLPFRRPHATFKSLLVNMGSWPPTKVDFLLGKQPAGPDPNYGSAQEERMGLDRFLLYV